MTAKPRFRFGIATLLTWTFVCALVAAVTRFLDLPGVAKTVLVLYLLTMLTYFMLRWPTLHSELRDLRNRRIQLKTEQQRLAKEIERRRAEKRQAQSHDVQA